MEDIERYSGFSFQQLSLLSASSWRSSGKFVKNIKLVDHLLSDYKKAEISGKEKAMPNYALRLTKSSADVRKEDIELLRKEGFSDGAILSINLVASYFNFVNRIALGWECLSPKMKLKAANFKSKVYFYRLFVDM